MQHVSPIECYKDCVILEGWRGMNRIRFTLNTMSVASMATNFILLLTSFLVATIQHPQKSTKCSKNHYFSFHYNSPPRKMFLCIEHASRTPSIKTLTLNADPFFCSPGQGLTRTMVLLKVRVFSSGVEMVSIWQGTAVVPSHHCIHNINSSQS